jgi:hypothetical protein
MYAALAYLKLMGRTGLAAKRDIAAQNGDSGPCADHVDCADQNAT